MGVNREKPIYLDYAATTPVDNDVISVINKYLGFAGIFGNPASNHFFGLEANQAVRKARKQVAQLINSEPKEIIFTSGATEANNLAIKGLARYLYNKKGKHIITAVTEHKAVLDCCKYLETEGFEITYLTPDQYGIIDLEQLTAAIRSDTILISIMHVNNEIGVIQDIKAIGALAKQYKIFFHVDAAQSAGKIIVDVKDMQIDLLSISAHKMYGPKGVGALYIRNNNPKVKLIAEIHGGGQERGFRSGTLPTHLIAGFGHACKLACEYLASGLENQRIYELRQYLWQNLVKQLPKVYLNGHADKRIPGNINISIAGIDGEALLFGLNKIAVSSSSACSSQTIAPSYVLKALGRSNELAHSSLRLSIGRYTTKENIDFALQHIIDVVSKLRAIAPINIENIA